MPSLPNPPVVLVSAGQLRRLFAENRYEERAAAGEFTRIVEKDKHPSPPRAPVPFCTRSQIVAYRNAENQTVALVHRYLLRDGTVGASGRPDPKLVFHDGVLYKTLPQKDL